VKLRRLRDVTQAWAATALVLAGSMSLAMAQQDAVKDYPNRNIRIIVGFGPGGGNDIVARLIGAKLSETLGRSVIIENKPGAGAILATEYVKNADPDGYTLLVAANGSMAVNAAIFSKLSYDPVRDFTPIGLIASFPLVLGVTPASPVKSVTELVAYAKAHPDKANYSGASPAFQLAVEQFKMKTGAPLQWIPYKSSAESITAVISGATLMTLVDTAPAVPQIKGGQMRALAVTAKERLDELPDVPTMAEAGVPDMDMSFWSGLFAPAATPPAIVKKLETEFVRIVALPDVRQKLQAIGVIPEGRPSEETRRFVEGEIARLKEVAKAANIKPQ
jgi:tripartite-type tricarboxylate transporter receptor subunit TctC